MVHSTHLKDDRLFECYLAARTGEMPDPRDAEHLADCPDCTSRYADLVGFMDDLRINAEAEADALFPPDRLQAQQQQILRRLTHLHRSARVISFPAREAAVAAPAVRVSHRWLAAAAAAGLFIGVAVGGFVGPAGFLRPVATMQVATAPTSARTAPSSPVRIGAPVELRDDDAFLAELETALASPQLRELQPFDAITPHVREIGTIVR